MKYRVEYTARAEQGLLDAYRWLAEEAPLNAARWLGGLEAAVEGLANFPRRCAMATEGDDLGFEVRQLVHEPYRVLFVVERRAVLILHIRHVKRRALRSGELGE
jgi:plasmid stabilization system protein ParE